MSTCQAIFCSAPWRATAGGHGQAVSPYANKHQLRLRPRNPFAFRHLTSLRLGDDPETGGGLDGRTTRRRHGVLLCAAFLSQETTQRSYSVVARTFSAAVCSRAGTFCSPPPRPMP